MMNSQELETAVRLGLDLTVIVLRDDAYGMIKWKQAHDGYPRLRHGPGQPGLREVRARATARAATARRRPTEFAPLLERALETPGVDLIDVPIDYCDNDRVLNEEIRG